MHGETQRPAGYTAKSFPGPATNAGVKASATEPASRTNRTGRSVFDCRAHWNENFDEGAAEKLANETSTLVAKPLTESLGAEYIVINGTSRIIEPFPRMATWRAGAGPRVGGHPRAGRPGTAGPARTSPMPTSGPPNARRAARPAARGPR